MQQFTLNQRTQAEPLYSHNSVMHSKRIEVSHRHWLKRKEHIDADFTTFYAVK